MGLNPHFSQILRQRAFLEALNESCLSLLSSLDPMKPSYQLSSQPELDITGVESFLIDLTPPFGNFADRLETQ
jgi:hypothetical protein